MRLACGNKNVVRSYCFGCFNRKVQILGPTSSKVGTMRRPFLGNDMSRLSTTLT